MKEPYDHEVIKFAESIHIKNEEVEYFMLAWDMLMIKFNIPEEHQAPIFYLFKSFYSSRESDFETIYDLNNSLKAINFFIDYRKSLNNVEAKHGADKDKFEELIKFQILASNIGIMKKLTMVFHGKLTRLETGGGVQQML